MEEPQNQHLKNITNLLAGVTAYKEVGLLGTGGFGLVVRALDLRARPKPVDIAIKLLPRGEFVHTHRVYIKREIIHQASMEHPLIISLREIFLTPTHLGMTMEYACGGDLHRYLLNQPGCRLPESEAKWIFQQLIIALDYSHRRGVSNRDLKLENLLLETSTDAQTRPVLKMCDFGYSKHEMNSSAKTVVGTATYMAPEILLGGLEKGTIYDAKKADAWAAGIILYALVFGRHPFNPDDPHHNRKLVACDYTLPNDSAVSVDCRRIIQSLLVADPVKRMSTHEVMNDPWFIDGIPSGALQMNERLLARHESEYGSNQGQKMPYRVDQLVEMACMPGSTDQEVLYLTL